ANPQMAWAPHEDLLLVASQSEEYRKGGSVIHNYFAAINPETGRSTIFRRDVLPLGGDINGETGVTALWTESGYGIAQYNAEPINGDLANGKWQTGFFVYNPKSGNVSKKRFEGVIFDSSYSRIAPSKAGYVAYVSGKALTVENLVTGKRHAFETIF